MATGEEKGGDFYAVLGLNKECSEAELRNAYKKLAMVRIEFHTFFFSNSIHIWFPFEKSFLGLKSISLDLWVCDDEQISGFLQSYAYKGVAQWLWDFDIRLGIYPVITGVTSGLAFVQ